MIDDDPGDVQAHSEYLEGIGGHEVIKASNARQAVEQIQMHRGSVDVVILDVMLPAGDVYHAEEVSLGLTTGALLVDLIRLELPGTPVLVWSGWNGVGQDVIRERIFGSGIPQEHYMAKPLGCAELLAKVNGVVRT